MDLIIRGGLELNIFIYWYGEVATGPNIHMEFVTIFWGWRGQMQSVPTFDWNFKYLESNFHSLDSNFICLEPIFSSLDCNLCSLEINFICLEPLAESLEVNFSSLDSNFICLEPLAEALEANFSSLDSNFICLEPLVEALEVDFSSFDDMFTFHGFNNPKCAECFYFLDFPRALLSIQLVTAKNHNNQSLTLDLKNVNKTMLAYYFGTHLDRLW